MIVTDTDVRTFCGAPESDSALLAMIHAPVEADVKRFLGWDPERATVTRYFPKGEFGGKPHPFVGAFGVVKQSGGTGEVLALDHKYVLNDSSLVVYECSGSYAGQHADTSWELLTKGTQYALEIDEDNTANGDRVSRSGHLLRLDADWPRSQGSVKVTYTAGFTANEFLGTVSGEDYTDASDIRYAVLQAVGRAYNQAKMHQYQQNSGRPGGLVTGESIQGYSYSMEGGAAVQMAGMAMALPVEVQERLTRYRALGKMLR